MSQCERCTRPLKPDDNRLCAFCTARAIEKIAWPAVRALFPYLPSLIVAADLTPFTQAKDALFSHTAHKAEDVCRETPHDAPLLARVAHASRMWQVFQDGEKTYKEHADHGAPAVEFYLLLIRAIHLRRIYRRYLRRRFGIDITRQSHFRINREDLVVVAGGKWTMWQRKNEQSAC
jgi:hypothetical protein